MPRLTLRHLARISICTLALASLAAGLVACVTRPDAQPTDDDLGKWYVHCAFHEPHWCLGPFRRWQEASQAGWEHEFWLHMGKNLTRVDHEPCEPTP